MVPPIVEYPLNYSGLIMMIFYSNRLSLEFGTYLIAISAIGTLITNLPLQVSAWSLYFCSLVRFDGYFGILLRCSNLEPFLKLAFKPIWPKRTSTIGSIYSGTFDGSAATFMLVKVCYQAFHWPLALLSTILACLSSISWLRTIFLMPTKILPRELPPNYDLSNETLIASCKRRGTIDEMDHRELQECLEKSKTRFFPGYISLYVIYNRRNHGREES